MKKVILMICAMALCLSLAACNGGKNNNGKNNGLLSNSGDVLLKSKNELKSTLGSYKITIDYSMGGGSTTLTEMRCEQGYAYYFDEGDAMYFIEFGKNKMYILDVASKTGTAMPIDSDDDYRNLDTMLLSQIFMFDGQTSGLVKTGTDKVAGRNTTVYTFKYLGILGYKIWVDNELGLTLKYSLEGGGEEGFYMEVKELRIGGVTLADIINLDEYEITDLSELYSE